MSHRRDIRPRYIQFVDSPKLFFFGRHLPAMLARDISDQEHIGAIVIQLEPIGHVFPQHARREWSKAFSVFNLEVHYRLHSRRARIAEDTPRTQGAWAKLHPSLM